MLLAELNIRHTRRHMPTRRVALDHVYLPTSGAGHGISLVATIVAVHLPLVPEEQRELLTRGNPARVLNIFRTLIRHPDLYRRWTSFGNQVLFRSSLRWVSRGSVAHRRTITHWAVSCRTISSRT